MMSPKFVRAPPSREAGEPGRLEHGWFFIPELGPLARPNPIRCP
jgi:hypothetical protein